MPGQHFAILALLMASQPVAAFQTAHKDLHGVLVAVEQPPREHIFTIYGPTFADGDFYFYIRHHGDVEQKIRFQGK